MSLVKMVTFYILQFLKLVLVKYSQKRLLKKTVINQFQFNFKRKIKNIANAQKVFYAKIDAEPVQILREFKNYFNIDELNVGDELNTTLFNEGDKVTVTGYTKGKGFQGVMKRHGFGGVGGTTHGQSDRSRAPG